MTPEKEKMKKVSERNKNYLKKKENKARLNERNKSKNEIKRNKTI